MILGLTGPEGGGKTTMMTWFALQHAIAGLPVLTFPGYELSWNGVVISRTIRVEDWIAMDDAAHALLQNSLLCIDEMQNHFDRMSYGDVKTRMFSNGVGAQRRKMNMGIVFTVQDINWGYGRLAWLAHVLADCYDLFWSPWGKYEGLERGELLRITFTDMKGFFTGEKLTEVGSIRLRGKPLREAFNSFKSTNVYENIARVRIKRPEVEIGFTDPEGEGAEGNPGQQVPAPNEAVSDTLRRTLERADHD